MRACVVDSHSRTIVKKFLNGLGRLDGCFENTLISLVLLKCTSKGRIEIRGFSVGLDSHIPSEMIIYSIYVHVAQGARR